MVKGLKHIRPLILLRGERYPVKWQESLCLKLQELKQSHLKKTHENFSNINISQWHIHDLLSNNQRWSIITQEFNTLQSPLSGMCGCG